MQCQAVRVQWVFDIETQQVRGITTIAVKSRPNNAPKEIKDTDAAARAEIPLNTCVRCRLLRLGTEPSPHTQKQNLKREETTADQIQLAQLSIVRITAGSHSDQLAINGV